MRTAFFLAAPIAAGVAIFATDLDTHATREVAKIPGGGRGNITINADETLIVGIGGDPDGKTVPRTPPSGGREQGLERRWAAGTPMMLYVVNIQTGEATVHDLKRLFITFINLNS